VTAVPGQNRRRIATAGGVYASAVLGVIGTLVVFRVLGPYDAGRFSIVIGVVQFLSLLIELTADEALVKYGFRYATQQDWGRFHRAVRVTFTVEAVTSIAAGILIAALAPFAGSFFSDAGGLTAAFLVAAPIPWLQSTESMASVPLILRGRYDIRGFFLTFGMALRLIGLVVGAPHGVTAAILGLLVAQLVTTVSIVGVGFVALRRFPKAAPAPLGEDRRPFVRFVVQSSIDTALDAFRTWIAPLALGIVRTATDVGLFRGAQAPQWAFAVLSAPVRLVLMTEQTRDWEAGRIDAVITSLRRYVVGSTLLMIAIVPPAELLMPWLVRILLGEDYLPAVGAARFVLAAAAIQLVFGWTKSFPVTIGRPGLRVVAHVVEVAVLVPLILIFGEAWGVTGAGAAVLVSTLAFAATWIVIVLRLRASHGAALAAAAAGLRSPGSPG
jgi:O-antigen/teichoic acid export membrane protein